MEVKEGEAGMLTVPPEYVFKPWVDCTWDEKIERWANASRVLNGLDAHARTKHWDMRSWGQNTACGTIACAAGHCGMDPWFRSRGLQLNFVLEEGMDPKNPHNWFERMSPVEPFFGNTGTEAIFYEGRPRPVERVIREVNAYLAALKKNQHARAQEAIYEMDSLTS